ncbi:MAG: polyamine aminopropyltransferase [Bacteroidetes bacterium]|jgi:spermidine synthase|nr:polyamine aminopropyltransferase [Bacteroidota bacterium]
MVNLGRHIIVEFYGCPEELLNEVTFIEQSFVDAAKYADATVINSTFHHFNPYGVSGVVVIQESHLAIHTWPEFGYAAIDVFTCGDTVDPWQCYQYLYKALQAGHGSAIEMGRGQLGLIKPELKQNGGGTASKAEGHDTTVEELKFHRNIWYTERNELIAMSLRHTGDVLFRDKSPYQKVEVYDTYAYGKLLTLDGKVMTTEQDEYVYHEMMTHPALHTHGAARRVLVIGGGDGGVVREVMRHEGVERCVMVEIDGMVIEASKQHLPTIASAFDNPKLELHVADGIAYVQDAPDGAFDVVIIDSTDPEGPAEGLFSYDFYRQVHRILAQGGIMVVQSESPRYEVQTFREIYACFREIFGHGNVHCGLMSIPTYPTGTWSFALVAKGGQHPVQDVDTERAEAFSHKHGLRYYNGDMHRAAFALPNYVKDLLKEPVKQ